MSKELIKLILNIQAKVEKCLAVLGDGSSVGSSVSSRKTLKRLSDKEKAQVVKRSKKGETAEALAEEFGVSPSMIYVIKRHG